jgi:hypothetical protein
MPHTGTLTPRCAVQQPDPIQGPPSVSTTAYAAFPAGSPLSSIAAYSSHNQLSPSVNHQLAERLLRWNRARAPGGLRRCGGSPFGRGRSAASPPLRPSNSSAGGGGGGPPVLGANGAYNMPEHSPETSQHTLSGALNVHNPVYDNVHTHVLQQQLRQQRQQQLYAQRVSQSVHVTLPQQPLPQRSRPSVPSGSSQLPPPPPEQESSRGSTLPPWPQLGRADVRESRPPAIHLRQESALPRAAVEAQAAAAQAAAVQAQARAAEQSTAHLLDAMSEVCTAHTRVVLLYSHSARRAV